MVSDNLLKQKAFDLLVNNSGYMVICLTSDASIIEFNQEAEYLYGQKATEVLNKNFFALCKAHNVTPPISDLSAILAGETIKDVVTTIHKNNNKIIIQWSISPIFDNTDVTHVLISGVNVTSYKLAIEKTVDLGNYLNNIINNIPHFIFWKDKNSVFLGCNKKFAESAGFQSSKDIIGKTDYEMPWAKEQSDIFIADDKNIMSTRTHKLNYEETQRQLDGTERTMLVSKVPTYNETNEVTGVLGIYTDITERKKMEADLKQANLKAEAANQIKTDFIHNMEHDIRTPFNGIWGIANILTAQETNPEKKELLNCITSCAKELLDYCNGILDFSQIESGSLPLLAKKFDIKKLVDDVIIMEMPASKYKRLDLVFEHSPDLPKLVIGDEYRLYRILLNLVSNAIKFTDTGYIKLTAKLAKKDNDQIIVKFLVQDTGIGIPKDKQDFIYESFARIAPAYKGVHKGMGLGLRIGKQFVQEMKGELDVISEAGKGSIFICTLPFKLPLTDDII